MLTAQTATCLRGMDSGPSRRSSRPCRIFRLKRVDPLRHVDVGILPVLDRERGAACTTRGWRVAGQVAVGCTS